MMNCRSVTNDNLAQAMVSLERTLADNNRLCVARLNFALVTISIAPDTDVCLYFFSLNLSVLFFAFQNSFVFA